MVRNVPSVDDEALKGFGLDLEERIIQTLFRETEFQPDEDEGTILYQSWLLPYPKR